MKSFLRCCIAFAVGLAAAIALSFLIAAVGHIALSAGRLHQAVNVASLTGQLHFHGLVRIKEHFGDCAMLLMEKQRPGGLLRNFVDTYYAYDTRFHPCDVLTTLYGGGPIKEPLIMNLAGHYVNYYFGGRHLLGVLLPVMELYELRGLYMMLSAGSIAFMLFGAMHNSPHKTLLILPIGLFLFFGFQMHLLGDNLPYAPAFFFSFTALGAFLAAKGFFRLWYRRVGMFAAIGTIITFFEPTTGTIPVVLALSITLNQIFYADHDVPLRQYWTTATLQAVVIVACFLLSFVLFTALRLLVLQLVFAVPAGGFFFGLTRRLGAYDQTIANVPDIASALWTYLHNNMAGGATFGVPILALSAAAWIAAFALLAAMWNEKREGISQLTVDMLVVAASAVGIFLWYRAFSNHIMEHPFFMVRLLAIPQALGFVALILVYRGRRGSTAHTGSRTAG